MAGPAHGRRVLRGQGSRASRSRPTSRRRSWRGCSNTVSATGHRGDVCFGTVDSWMAWSLSGAALHITDHTNAAVTGLCGPNDVRWNERVLELFAIPDSTLPTIVALEWCRRCRHRAPGRPADRRPRRRPAGIARRSGLRATWYGEDHVRHRRNARPVPGQHPPASPQRGAHGSYPDRGVVASRSGLVRLGSDHAGGGRATSNGCVSSA